MSIKGWELRHVDAFHPTGECEHCRLTIAEYGPMPSREAMKLIGRYPQMADHLDLNPVCAYCGSANDLTGDHIVPRSQGGKDTAGNLQVLCQPCNAQKGAR